MFNNIRDRFRYFSTIRVAQLDIEQLRTGLLAESTLDINYVVLILGSCAITTLGLLSNSAGVIIGYLCHLKNKFHAHTVHIFTLSDKYDNIVSVTYQLVHYN